MDEAACDMHVAGMLLRLLVRVLRHGHQVASDTHDVVMTHGYDNDPLIIKPGTSVQRVMVSMPLSTNFIRRQARVTESSGSTSQASICSAYRL